VSKNFTILGYDELVKDLKRLPGAALDASAVGQFNAAQATMVVSKARAPYEHGDLEKAAFVELPRITAFAAIVQMGFYGIDYIARQHETGPSEYQHPGTRTRTKNRGRAQQGQWKFLESAVQDTQGDTNRIIAAAVDYFIRTGRLPAMKGSIRGRQ